MNFDLETARTKEEKESRIKPLKGIKRNMTNKRFKMRTGKSYYEDLVSEAHVTSDC